MLLEYHQYRATWRETTISAIFGAAFGIFFAFKMTLVQSFLDTFPFFWGAALWLCDVGILICGG